MRLKMSQNSLFAILMRSPWWVSLLVGLVLALIARALLPENLSQAAFVSALPFVLIAGIALYKQLKTPSVERATAILEKAGALSWKDFSAALEQALREDGYSVTRLGNSAADFTLYKEGKSAVLAARRWKAANQGVEPLRELQAAREKEAAAEAIYVASAALSESARRYAQENNIRLLQGVELARLLRGLAK
jgi:restriction system protein